MFYVLFSDGYRLWRAMGAPGKRTQPAPEILQESLEVEESFSSDNLPAPLPAAEQTVRPIPRLTTPPTVPTRKLDPETRRKRRELLKEAANRSADLSTTIRETRKAIQHRPVPHSNFEAFVLDIEQIADQAEADPAEFQRFEEFLGVEIYTTWRQMQTLLPPAPARRLVHAYVRLAQVAQQNGAPLETQWAFYLLAYALDPRLNGAFRQATQVADQLHLRTPEAQTLRLLTRRSA